MNPAETVETAAAETCRIIAEALNGRRSGDGYMACCPAHNDRNPSLSLRVADGKVLVHCHTGCIQERVIGALDALGLWHSANASVAPRKRQRSGTPVANIGDKVAANRLVPVIPVPPDAPEAPEYHDTLGFASRRWPYLDAERRLLGYVVRFETDSDKTMRPLTYCKDGHGRCRWDWSAPSKPRPLYGLDRLAAAPEAYVVVCEGEKAADAAQTLFADRPIVAVSWPGGANGVDVVDLTPLHNRAVAIWPDADEVGRNAARRLCSHLVVKTSETPLILAIPENKPDGWDAADALAEGWSTEDLECLIREGSRYSSDIVDEPRIFRSRTQFALVPATEIPLKAPEWLIRDLLELDTFACLFGEPSAAKSFMGLNIACCVASGLDFHGHPVRRSPVAYLAGEGFNGIMRRVHAWALRNQCDPRPYLQVSEGGAALTDATGAEEVDEALRQMAESHGAPALIVVDTLARNFGPADENSTQDMNAFIEALDAIRRRHNATVLVIHHTGHGDKSRGRGSMALKAGLDAEYRLEKDNKEIIRLESQKMKDAPTPPPRAFQLVSVELPITDEYNRVVTSAVLDEVEWQPRRKKGDSGTYKNQVLAVLDQLLESARENLQESGSPPDQAHVELRTWSDACGQKGIPRQRFSDARKALVDEGSVVQEGSSVFRP